MLQLGLPIKCLEAVVLAAYLTAGRTDVVRIPVAFKSRWRARMGSAGSPERDYRHIVLVVYVRKTGHWGALGLSRRSDLMDKSCKYKVLL